MAPEATERKIAKGGDVDEDADQRREDSVDKGDERNEPTLPYARRVEAGSEGFFTIRKSGQGYWTRVGTAVGAALLGLLTAWQIYNYLPAITTMRSKGIAFGIAAAFFLGFALLAWWLMNKPSNVEFLIATDGEMKKVNWTSRRELIGSTKIVILFMLLIAVFLFLIDIEFHWIFHKFGVLRAAPPVRDLWMIIGNVAALLGVGWAWYALQQTERRQSR